MRCAMWTVPFDSEPVVFVVKEFTGHGSLEA